VRKLLRSAHTQIGDYSITQGQRRHTRISRSFPYTVPSGITSAPPSIAGEWRPGVPGYERGLQQLFLPVSIMVSSDYHFLGWTMANVKTPE